MFAVLFYAVCLGINIGNIFWVSLFRAGWKVVLLEAACAAICLLLLVGQINIHLSAS